LESLMAVANPSRELSVNEIWLATPLTVSVKLEEELMFSELGSVTAVAPALLTVVVDEPSSVTWMEYVPGRVVDCAEAVTTDVSEELAETLPLVAVAIPCSAVCSESKDDPRLARADCCD